MVRRVLVWLGAGMLTAGVAAGMVAGAGVASADSPPGADTKGTTSSESANSTENKPDSDNDGAGTAKPKPVRDEAEKNRDGRPQGRPSTPMRPSRATKPRPLTNRPPNSW